MSAWPTAQIGEIAESVDYGVTASATLQPGGPKFLRITDIQGGAVNWDSVPWCDCNARSSVDSQLKPGDIVFARTGATTGKSFLIRKCPTDTVFASYLIRLRVGPTIESAYLSHFFQTPQYWAQITKNTRGVAQPGVNATTLKTLKIPIPPLAEQRRIAEILDRAEALRAKRRAALTQLDTLIQAIFINMFGDTATNPKGWPVMALGDIVREKPNNGIFRKNPEYEQDDTKGIAVVWVEELFRGSSIDTKESRRVIPTKAETSKYGLHYGDVLFCRSSLKLDGIAFNNVYLGQDNVALFECHLIRVQPNMSIVSPIYLNFLLRLPQMRAIAKSKSKTATMTTIDQTALCSIPVMLPLVALQQEFARRVSAVEKLKAAHHASLAEMDALFASLQHRAFRGEL
jgi:type I restriction enzyme S subunit